jgi:hypothetical protein
VKRFGEINGIKWARKRTVTMVIMVLLLGVILFLQMSFQTGFQTKSLAIDPPQAIVTQFYEWYIRNNDQYRDRIAEQQRVFTPELYRNLVAAFQKQPQDGAWLDFDPFSNTQVGSFSVVVRSVRQSPQNNLTTEVDIDIYAGLRRPGTPVPIKVLVGQQDGQWQIKNLVYMSTWDNLLCYLKEINQAANRQ